MLKEAACAEPFCTDAAHGHDHGHAAADHGGMFVSWSFESDRAVQPISAPEAFDAARMQSLFSKCPTEIDAKA